MVKRVDQPIFSDLMGYSWYENKLLLRMNPNDVSFAFATICLYTGRLALYVIDNLFVNERCTRQFVERFGIEDQTLKE